MRVTLLGVGEAFAPEPNSAALVEASGFELLIDCGHAVPPALWRARPDLDALDAVYLTHHHADHVLGLVPVFERWAFEGRTRKLTVLTTIWGIEQLRRLFEAMSVPAGAFPVHYEVAAETPMVGPFRLAQALTEHTTPNYAVRLEAGGRRLAWSGDGRPTAEAKHLYAEADLLFHECFFPEAEPTVSYHCDLPTVRKIRGPPRIGVYHVRDGDRGTMRKALAGDPRLFLPEAGETIEV